MVNKFGIPEKMLIEIRDRDQNCVYCHKKMIYPYNKNNAKDSATIEHLNYDGPFYWKTGLQEEDIAICCGECNSSRGKKELKKWFKSSYCKENKINKDTVSSPIKKYIINQFKNNSLLPKSTYSIT
jgi:hypothetical protein